MNTLLFLVCILCICTFFCILYLFFMLSLLIIHLPKLGTRVRLIWGDEAFFETNITRVLLFIMHDVYVVTVSL